MEEFISVYNEDMLMGIERSYCSAVQVRKLAMPWGPDLLFFWGVFFGDRQRRTRAERVALPSPEDLNVFNGLKSTEQH